MGFGLIEWIAYIIVLVGGLNSGIYGLLKLNLISSILGEGFIGRVVYLVIGISAGYLIYIYFKKKST